MLLFTNGKKKSHDDEIVDFEDGELLQKEGFLVECARDQSQEERVFTKVSKDHTGIKQDGIVDAECKSGDRQYFQKNGDTKTETVQYVDGDSKDWFNYRPLLPNRLFAEKGSQKGHQKYEDHSKPISTIRNPGAPILINVFYVSPRYRHREKVETDKHGSVKKKSGWNHKYFHKNHDLSPNFPLIGIIFSAPPANYEQGVNITTHMTSLESVTSDDEEEEEFGTFDEEEEEGEEDAGSEETNDRGEVGASCGVPEEPSLDEDTRNFLRDKVKDIIQKGEETEWVKNKNGIHPFKDKVTKETEQVYFFKGFIQDLKEDGVTTLVPLTEILDKLKQGNYSQTQFEADMNSSLEALKHFLDYGADADVVNPLYEGFEEVYETIRWHFTDLLPESSKRTKKRDYSQFGDDSTGCSTDDNYLPSDSSGDNEEDGQEQKQGQRSPKKKPRRS
mmetsp:Transcript_19852/g.27896  ORF Transcript_19852/g.27896 Transcript_19852/m.27896 type:complete len:446 (-) Transcript_19852:85-1422(-)